MRRSGVRSSSTPQFPYPRVSKGVRVRGNHISLAEFAEQEGISPRTLERRAYKDGWLAEVERRLEQQHLAVIEHSSAVTAELRRRLESDLKSIDKLVPDVEN